MSNRACYIANIRQDILDHFGVGETSAQLLMPNKILLPVGGEKLMDKKNTHSWAKRVKKELDDKYQAKFYGSQVVIDNRPLNGTIVDIVITSKLIDSYVDKYGDQTTMFQLDPSEVQYTLKAANILSSDKAIEWFKKADKHQWRGDMFWQKLSSDLQIPKEQVNLLKDLKIDNPYNREQLLTSLLASYSYSIEIKTAKDMQVKAEMDYQDRMEGVPKEAWIKEHELPNDMSYENLNVPGGTNYTNNEIKTPDIIPSIKGHAQFSTDQGIGWFRSDDKAEGTNLEYRLKGKQLEDRIKYLETSLERGDGSMADIVELKELKEGVTKGGVATKTRRILEVQSDLFQKGRERGLLTNKPTDEVDFYDFEDKTYSEPKDIRQSQVKEGLRENNFLQLLNKDNNWVTFFVKSIVQDSIKKGYEKVVFPTGNTASKIEGHSTLEEFKKQKEDRLEEIEDTKYEISQEDSGEWIITKTFGATNYVYGRYSSKENAQDRLRVQLDNINIERKQLKQELERVEKEGFAALAPIYKFYEETLGNVLKKTYKDIKRTKDEYSNEWYELDITDEIANQKILLQTTTTNPVHKKNELTDKSFNLMLDYIKKNNIKVEFLESLREQYKNDPVAVYDIISSSIKINANKADLTTLPEELGHHLTIALGKDHTLVKRALNLIGKTNYKKELGQDYIIAYKGDEHMLRMEYLGKLISKAIVGRIPDEVDTEAEFKVWDTVWRIIEKFISLFTGNTNITDQLDKITAELADMITEGKDVTNNKKQIDMGVLLHPEMYSLDTRPKFATKFLANNPDLGAGKRFSVRPRKYQTGVYKIGNDYYNITLTNENAQMVSEVKNAEFLKKKSIGDEEIKYEHIQNFYDGKVPMYIYQIQKIDGEITNELKESVVNKPKVTNTKVAKEKKQEVYFKRLIKNLKKRNKELEAKKSSTKTIEEMDKIKAEIELNQGNINSVQASLDEYAETNNKQLLINLSNSVLDGIEAYISTLESSSKDTVNIDNIEHNVKLLHIFEELTGTSDRAKGLYERIKPFITKYSIQVISEATGREISEEDLDNDFRDIFVGAKNFGTLSDVNNLLGRGVGFLIKKGQNTIAQDNRTSYDSVKKHVDILEKWAKDNNIGRDKMYDIFIQDYKNTTILTREYASEFYEIIDKSYNDPNGLATRKKYATYNRSEKKWVPRSDKHFNPAYKKIQNTPALKQFHSFFKATIESISEDLPIKLNENFIPNIAEQSLMDILKSDKDIMSKFKDAVSNITEIYDSNAKEDAFISDENLLVDDIPLKYIGSLSKDLKSKDLGASLLKFMYFANNYRVMSEILPKTRLLQEEIKSRAFVSNVDSSRRVMGEDTNIFKMADEFIKMQVKGDKKRTEKLGNFEYAKYIDFGIKYTSLLRIGLNPFNAITNVFVGNIGNVIEAVGGRFFTWKEYTKARKIFFEQSMIESSKLNKLINIYNPLMELEDYENLESITTGKKTKDKYFNKIMYSPQRYGEKMLQSSTMIASLMHDKITTKEGKKISIWEAFDENGVWKKDEIGYELNEDMIFRTSNKIQRINQMIHGRYSAKDAAILQQYSLFRAVFQFKKWMPAAFEVRFADKKIDDRLGVEIEGRYHTWIKYFKLQHAKLKKDAQKIQDLEFTETDVYNMRKNLMELTILAATILAAIGLKSDDDDVKKNGWYKFAMSQLDRVSGDLMFFYRPDDMANSATRAMPLAKTALDLAKVFKSIPYAFGIEGSTYDHGPRADENKFIASILDVTPVAKPLADVVRMAKKENYIEPN